MIDAVAKQQLMNDIEKLGQHNGHDPIDILRSRTEPILGSRYPLFDGTNVTGTHAHRADGRLRICQQTRAERVAHIQ